MEITRKIYVHWKSDEWSANGGDYSLWDMDMSFIEGYSKPLVVHETTIEVPEVDARGLLVSSLREKKAKIISEATEKAKQIDQKIEELLALPAA